MSVSSSVRLRTPSFSSPLVPGRARVMAALLLLAPGARAAELPDVIECEGSYPGHLQGVCTDGAGAFYWAFTDVLLKTDAQGRIEKRLAVRNHHGDLCFHDGKVYVAVNFGPFNDPEGKADSWVYVYDADDLRVLGKHETPELIYGAGGMAEHGGRFFVVGGLPPEFQENYVYEYDADFRFLRRHVLASKYTLLGIQTAAFDGTRFWFGCYGNPPCILSAPADLDSVTRFDLNASYGIVPRGGDRFWIARGGRTSEGEHTGRLIPARREGERLVEVTP